MSRFAWLPAYGCLTWMFAVSNACVASVYAAEQPVGMRFTIPAQPLSSALIAFGKQANVQVLTAGQTVDALRSHDATGTFGVEAALSKLLEGTGMTYTFVDARTVVIKPGTAKPSTLRAASSTQAVTLLPIQAIGLVGKDEGFMADVSSGPTRTVSDPLDVPQSVGIVTQGLLQSQQVQTIAEAIQNVAGAQYVDGSSGLPIFDVRGFTTGNGMTDGMPNNIMGVGDFPPMIGVERVEVLKGPEAILGDTSAYNNFGGLIDVVLKKPQPEAIHQLTFSIGEHGEKQLGVDLAGALNNSKSLSYRLVMNGDFSGSTLQGVHGKRDRYVAPSIGWSTAKTTLVAGVSWMMNHTPIPDHTILLDGTLSSAAPPGVRLDNPGDNTAVETRRLYYMLEHRFNPILSFRSRAQYVRESIDSQYWLMDGMRPDGDATATAQDYRTSDAYYVLQNDVTASFGNSWMQHAIVLGFDYSRIQLGNGYYAFSNNGEGMPYNIFTGGPLPPAASALSANDYANGYFSGEAWTTETGLFLQDQVALGSHWQVLVAWRRTGYELQTEYPDGTPWNQRRVQWVPNYGVVYKLTPNMSIYANTSNGFQPDTGLGKDNRPLPPALSRQIELGTKLDLFQNKARLTVAAYRIMLNNSADLFSLQPPYYFISGPGQSNKGVEVEFNGEIAPGWDVSAALTNALIHNDDGSLPLGASRRRFNLWSSYTFQHGSLRGFGVAGGVLARSSTWGELSDYSAYIHIPGQASVAANVFYRTPRWSVTLGVKNLLDRTLYGPQFDETFVPFLNRRTYLLSGSVDF
ncbi:TonB-dependent siderophore receptor [Dyella flava]|uniref:TonB-dependent receptor n=1 Tax=Dyella flava TaxID=1920170 RepID=A0ABS2K013_9GAMM|nr:TonB-dependent receptor [Dyella flava]MBM7124589.1 TonB-dependent receptor [Dyella flava]GLQ49241.1 ferrichrome-iron receptor [Dyella flava]